MPSGGSYRRPVGSHRRFPPGASRQTRPRQGVVGGPATALNLPTAITIGVNAITATQANLIASINPNSAQIDCTTWFTYGTSLPLPGLTTPVVDVGTGTNPVTTTCEVTGLTTGLTYYFAAVAQNSAGTVYGQTLSFLATSGTPIATQPVVPFGQTAVALPHFSVPFALVTSGTSQGAVVVEQDTNEEVLACVNTIVECPLGACPQLSTFGIPIPTFAQEPVDPTEMVTAIQNLEPRATIDAISQLLSDGQTWGIALETSTTSSGQS